MLHIFVFKGIADLSSVLKEFRYFSKERWMDFGHICGLFPATIKAIQTAHPGNVNKCLEKCVAFWLMKKDNVTEEGLPTLLRLADIMDQVGDSSVAETIRRRVRGKGQ